VDKVTYVCVIHRQRGKPSLASGIEPLLASPTFGVVGSQSPLVEQLRRVGDGVVVRDFDALGEACCSETDVRRWIIHYLPSGCDAYPLE
jgi:hypothetical protein